MASKLARGVVHGKTIELTKDLGLAEGQEVEVQVRVVVAGRTWGEGILRSAGILADDPEWDDIMEQIDRQRRGLHGSDPRKEDTTAGG
jgi:hypothetical protein